MNAGFAQMRRVHHRAQSRFDGTARIGQEVGDAGQGFILLGIEDVQDRPDKQAVAGFFPMVALIETAFGIDQYVRDILHVADFPFALAHLQQRVIGGGLRIGRIEQQDATVPRTEARCQGPVLTLDVVDDAASWPGQ